MPPCLFNLYAEYISEMPGWMNYKLQQRFLGEISTTSDMQDDTTLMAKSEEQRSLLMGMIVKNEKAGLKLNIQKTKIMVSGPITSCEIDWEAMETVRDLFGGAPKSLQMVIAATKLKDTCSLEEKL